ncbi:hypothetical protein Tco_1151711 [Tanacetum coccineum]
MIQPESEGSAHGHSIARLEVLRYDLEKNEKREECGLRHELSPEQSQHGDSNDVLIFLKDIKNSKVKLRTVTTREVVSYDELDEIASFQDKYEQDGQNHKMIKKVKQDDDARLKISRTQSQKTKAQDRRSKHEGTRTL